VVSKVSRWITSCIYLPAIAACASANATVIQAENATAIHSIACSEPRKSDNKWNIQELYSCDARELFIPYQLWTGASWSGDKDASCMHPSDSLFYVNGVSATTISGPERWQNPLSGETESYWSRKKVNGSKTQFFTCHKLGIGRVYDSRGPRHYRSGRCKFPAGYGWKIGNRRHCRDTSIEIIAITLDGENNLESLTFKWWYGITLDHIYRYAPNKGMVNAWRQ
jgi:hypothetical protein